MIELWKPNRYVFDHFSRLDNSAFRRGVSTSDPHR